MEKGSPKIEISDLDKVYRQAEEETVALRDVSLDIKEGEFFSIIGPSGCGKSTLLHIIAGLVDKTNGEVKQDGEPINKPSAERGVVFQELGLFPWMTVKENVAYGLKLSNNDKKEIKRTVNNYLSAVGLEKFKDSFIHQLSGGMKARVALVRSLANDPKVLLMDEPFGGLDEITKEILQEELERLWEDTEKTIIFITHDIEEATFLSDRIGVMTNRPGSFRDISEVNLERPRRDKYPDRSKEEFIRFKKDIGSILKEEGKQSMNIA
ncbi:MAG: ABC-type nitrate/sulfonate/bicarbonate transport system ATPase component [Candidatus Methanohalarchaeum thermophilum]|uniref:ABC-type nitrate/sulfonate/bicarbonate transport system ATPase component n=1 Tax=Methanohalarchaeum thermophilum TaxID=1903181 RepID=A0A1Q6DU62_METT1|nr:MAG: ABC-type nitrate/sulfonate/bicarbonate transport system ATPase component [Candidatus Methanohalarchaeum thermophilum]